jgi:aryl-alcohol dehydrogenase-like predicted oxidoreductase
VQYSILDQRPGAKMAAAANERGIKILAYGTLLGGFFSEKWLGQAEPKGFETVSQQKVGVMVGGVCVYVMLLGGKRG